MSDPCCGPAANGVDTEPGSGPDKWWGVRELQLAALAAALLLGGWALHRSGLSSIGLGLELAAVAAGAATFAPGAVRSLRHGRVGVGTLMTIAAVGAVALDRSKKPRCWESCSPSPKDSSTTPSPEPAEACAPCCRSCRQRRP